VYAVAAALPRDFVPRMAARPLAVGTLR